MSIQLLQGEALHIIPTLKAGTISSLITDPPYSSGGQFRGDRLGSTTSKYQRNQIEREYEEFTGDNRDMRGWCFWSTMWLLEAFRVLKDGAPVCLFTDWRMLPATTDVMQAAGFVWRGVAVWDKTEGAKPYTGRFRHQAEYIVWGSKGAMPFDRLDTVESRCLPGVFRCSVKQADKHHLTGKPTDLMRQVVKITEPGGIILDPFMGSGTTGVAAKKEGFPFIGVDLSAGNVEIARRRTGQADSQNAGQLSFDR